ncbi:MAG: hypothetical protein K1X64_01575 [Myxococcaceae bacterium]|nr:hypothetical protein [Myxococcaceae bacterium]
MTASRATQLVEAGLWLRLSGDDEGARRLFEQALKIDPAHARARQLIDTLNKGGAAPSGAAGAGPGAAPTNKSPFERQGGTDLSMDVDWGLATGFAADETKPPLPPDDHLLGDEPLTTDDDDDSFSIDEEPLVSMGELSQSMPGGLNERTPAWGVKIPALARGEAGTGLNLDRIRALAEANEPEIPPLGTVPTIPPLMSPPAPMPGLPRSTTIPFSGQSSPSSLSSALFDDAPAPMELPLTMEDETLAPPSQVEPELSFEMNEFETIPNEASAVGSSPPSITAAPVKIQSAWDSPSNPSIDLSRPGASSNSTSAIDMLAPPLPRTQTPLPTRSAGQEVDTLLKGAKELLELDDHSGAMELILKAEALGTGNAEVQRLKTRSEHTLLAMYESKLGALSMTPRVKLKEDDVIWLNLDHRAGFVLAQIDGTVTYEDLFELSGMSRIDTARILAQLIEQGVIMHQ